MLRKLIVSLALFAVTLEPCAFAADDLVNLQAAFLRGEYEHVVEDARVLRNKFSSHEDELLYLEGVSALKLRRLDQARAQLTTLISQHPQSPWFAQAWAALGESWVVSGDNERALEILEGLLKDARSAEIKAQVRLSIAKVQRRMGKWSESKWALESVVEQVPDSPQAGEAKTILRGSDFHFSVQVGAFTSPGNAKRLKVELARRGYRAEVTRAATQGRTFHRVRVGRFESRAQARNMEGRLKREGFPTRIIP